MIKIVNTGLSIGTVLSSFETKVLSNDEDSGRYNFFYKDEEGDERGYGGIHCGEVFEFKLNDAWVSARVERAEDWYLVGMPGLRLDGIEVRR